MLHRSVRSQERELNLFRQAGVAGYASEHMRGGVDGCIRACVKRSSGGKWLSMAKSGRGAVGIDVGTKV